MLYSSLFTNNLGLNTLQEYFRELQSGQDLIMGELTLQIVSATEKQYNIVKLV